MSTDHEKIQEAIAEVLGYRRITQAELDRSRCATSFDWNTPYNTTIKHLPDWENDLNACRELWEFLQTQSETYQFAFCVCIPKQKLVENYYTHMLVEPRIHCQAFLKAMGKEEIIS